MSEEEKPKTGCVCSLAGFCSKHGVTKSPHQHKLCQTHPGYFQQWEECRGPGQRFINCDSKETVKVVAPAEVPIEVLAEPKLPPVMPTLTQQAKNFGSAMLQHAKSGFKHVTEEVKQDRLSICATCPFLSEGRCTKCGCFLDHKASLSTSHCPISKW